MSIQDAAFGLLVGGGFVLGAQAKLQQEMGDRQQLEAALQDRETQLSLTLTIIDHLPIAVFVKDGRADHFGEMLLWNQTSERMFGVKAEQALGKTIYAYFPKEQADFFEQKDREAFERGIPADIPEEPIDSYSLGQRILHTVKVPLYNDHQQPEYLLCFSEDITDRKQAEVALRESEARWQFALEGAEAGVWDWHTQTNTVFYSQQWKALLGYADDEVGNSLEEWDSRVHPDDKAQCYADLQKYLRNETPVFQNEHRMRCKDGRYKWILDCGKVVEWTPEGQPLRMIGSHTDISERKRVEEELRQAVATNQALLSAIPDLILRISRDGIYRDGIPTKEVPLLTTADQLIGKSLWEMLPADLAQQRLDAIERAFQTELTQIHEYPVSINGEWRYEEARCVVCGEDEAMVLVRDITGRKQAELEIRHLNEALEEQNQNLEALVEQRTAELLTFINALPDYICVIEREAMRVPFCNDQFASTTLLGDRSLVQGKTIFECFPADNVAYFAEQSSQVFASGHMLHTQESLMLPSGEMHLDTYKIPLKRPTGEVYALIETSRDITELVLARQALMQRSAQLEASNQELESFSYSVSHDLRAPLRHINGFVNALRQKLDGHHALTDPKVIHYLQVIESSSQKMALLIDGLLTLSRIGRKPIEPQPVSLRELVDEAIALVQSSSEPATSVEFVVGELSTVQGDATLLQQVLSNLINNAVKFSRNQPNSRVEIGRLPEGAIFIKDNGVGFQMEYADKLFGAFQRLHSQTAFEGTGIGLAIVQRIVHRHGGTIWAESQPNQGATFYFTVGSLS